MKTLIKAVFAMGIGCHFMDRNKANVSVAFKVQLSDSECTFRMADLDFFGKIDKMYSQVENDVDIGQILAANIEENRLESYYRYCRCGEMNAARSLSRLCRAVSVLYLMTNNEPKTLKRNKKYGFTNFSALRGNSYHAKFEILRSFSKLNMHYIAFL